MTWSSHACSASAGAEAREAGEALVRDAQGGPFGRVAGVGEDRFLDPPMALVDERGRAG
ncbi:hypothetical protein AB0878_19625 [Amycolatopsis sp. NPDC047767]|uniref:hypothetical protein n=1 Tax=Amycolatopsis sp. NPDC047767 TaxID=3156765 RepID=UPI0034543147